MAGGSRASAGPPSQRSAQGEPRPVAPGPSGGTYAAHNHTRARAHARARPRCTLQHTIPLHCTCTTHAHFCTCTMTCPPRRGAGGRSGRHRARKGGAAPTERHRGPPQGLQPLQHEATRRFGTSTQLADKSAAGRGSSRRATCDASFGLRWPRSRSASSRALAGAAREGTQHQPPLAAMLHMYGSGAVTTPYDLGLYNPGRPGSGLGLSAAPHSTERAPERHQRSTGKAQEPSEASVWIAPGIQLIAPVKLYIWH